MNFKKVKQPVYLHDKIAYFTSSEIRYISKNHTLKKNVTTIIFKGLNNKNLRDKIFQQLNINNIFKCKKKLAFQNVNLVINRLKYSGYFNNIKASYLVLKHRQYLVIQLHLNPILKQIVIRKGHGLKISINYFNSILKKQIGYPQSLKFINAMIQKMQSWYFIRGYKWIKISYKSCRSNLNKLEIRIIESQIREVQIICTNNINKLQKRRLKHHIINELKLLPGQQLNFYNIELGIIKLKTQKLLSNCSYKIQYTSQDTLKVIIKYSCLEEKILYFFNRRIYLPYYTLDSIYDEPAIAFNYLLQKFNNSLYWKYLIAIYINLQTTTTFFTLNDTNYQNLIISNFLQIKDILRNTYKKGPFIILRNSLKFEHYLKNLNRNLSHFTINIEKKQIQTKFIISYKYPLLKDESYNKNHLSISIFQKIHRFKDSIVKVIFEQMMSKKFFFTYYYNTYGTEITSIKNLSSNLYILQRTSLFNDIQKVNISYKSTHKVSQIFFRLKNKVIKNKVQVINQKFLYYIIDIKSNIMNLAKELVPSNSWHFYFRSYKPFTINLSDRKNEKKINHFTKIEYIKIVKFSTDKFNDLLSVIIFHVKMETFWCNMKQLSTNTLNFFNYWQILHKLNIDSSIKIYQYFHIDLEYYIYKKYNIYLFIFLDYKQYYNASKFQYADYRIYQTKKDFPFYGIGLQINLPIKQMPIIKVKYQTNNHGKCRLYTKLYFK